MDGISSVILPEHPVTNVVEWVQVILVGDIDLLIFEVAACQRCDPHEQSLTFHAYLYEINAAECLTRGLPLELL
jgi:hypothetical protein